MGAKLDIPGLPPRAFEKEDGGEDGAFYVEPRMVTHIDEAAIGALRAFYRTLLPPGGDILDLMSSWVSHLPEDIAYGAVIGHGMNAQELAANPRLTRWFVQDLNRDPVLPLEGASLDAVMICVAVQYLQQPAAVFAEIARVLRAGAPLVVSFSNRCFPTKAVALWLALDDRGHAALVDLYLRTAGFADVTVHRLCDGRRGDPLTALVGRKAGS